MSDTIILQYGCPSCGSIMRKTGEYEWEKTEKPTRLRAFLWKIKILPRPTKTVLTRRPVYVKCGGPITLVSVSYRPTAFHCPHCDHDYYYQVRQWKGEESIQWFVPGDGGRSLLPKYEVSNCRRCGGKLTHYGNFPKYADDFECRACGAVFHQRDPDVS